AANLNIPDRLTFDRQRFDAVDTIADPIPTASAPVEMRIEITFTFPLTSLQSVHGKLDSYSSAYFNLLSSCDAACITASVHSKHGAHVHLLRIRVVNLEEESQRSVGLKGGRNWA